MNGMYTLDYQMWPAIYDMRKFQLILQIWNTKLRA